MSNPAEYLPGPISINVINELLISIGLAKAFNANIIAEYYFIYRITILLSSVIKKMELILWVFKYYLPRIEITNKVGVIT